MRSGRTNHYAGLAAEEQVARHYARTGHDIARLRWRGQGGEIDLICRKGRTVIFVEVKRARSFEAAAARVSSRQIARIRAAAGEFLEGEPLGARTDSRIDVALVDGAGRIEILSNAAM